MSVQELADRMEIVELVARCLIAVDDKDWDAVAACYTEDARIDYGGRIGPVDGAGKVAEVLRRTLETVDVTQHLVTNSVVRLDGDRATHVAYVHAQHQRGDDFYTVGCRYDDRLIRTDEGWRLCHRVLHRVWKSGDPHVIQPRSAT